MCDDGKSKNDEITNPNVLENKEVDVEKNNEVQARKDIYGWGSERTAEIYNNRHICEEAECYKRENEESAAELIKGKKE